MKSINKLSVLVTSLFVINLMAFSQRCLAQNEPSSTNSTNAYNNPSGTNRDESVQTGTNTTYGSQSEKDSTFVSEAANINLEEIKLGQLAESHARNKETKDLGAMMVREHRKAQDELASLAARKGYKVPTTVNNSAQKAYDNLSKLNGHDFDEDYTEMMVKGHKAAIDKFEKASKESSDPDIATWASNMLPTLRTHLQHAQTCHDMAKNMTKNKTKKSKTNGTEEQQQTRGK